jgi:hypothetical protein
MGCEWAGMMTCCAFAARDNASKPANMTFRLAISFCRERQQCDFWIYC